MALQPLSKSPSGSSSELASGRMDDSESAMRRGAIPASLSLPRSLLPAPCSLLPKGMAIVRVGVYDALHDSGNDVTDAVGMREEYGYACHTE